MENTNLLSQEDLQILSEKHSNTDTIKVLDKVTNLYNNQESTEKEKLAAEQIFSLLVKHAETEIRKALSENLMHNKEIPHDIVFTLAHDVKEISLPVLEFSEVLTDEDLIEIIESSQSTAAQLAIAKRVNISQHVSSSLVNTKKTNVVSTLFENETAEISQETYQVAIDEFTDNQEIVESMVTSGSLPENIMTALTEKVSAQMQKKIESKHKRSFSSINKFFEESKDSAVFKLSTMHNISQNIINCVYNSHKKGTLNNDITNKKSSLYRLLDSKSIEGQLTPFAALIIGDILLFEISISRILKLPLDNTQRLIEDPNIGVDAIYKKARLPQKMFEASKSLIHQINLMNDEASYEGTKPAKDDLVTLVKRLMEIEKKHNTPNLSHFIAAIRNQIHNV